MSLAAGAQQPLELPELFARLDLLLAPPVERWADPAQRNRPAMRGLVAGRRATLRLTPILVGKNHVDSGRSVLELALEGRTFGVQLLVTPPAVLHRSGPPAGDAEFDARHDVVGAPRAVLDALFHADLRARMKAEPSSLRFDGDRLEIVLDAQPRSVDSVAAILAIATAILEQLPAAIRAGGAGHFLEQGSLAAHPEVVALASRRRRLRLLVLGIAALFVGVFVLALVAVLLVVWGAVSR